MGYLNVVPQQGKGEIRNNFWSVRVVQPWNLLPDSVNRVESLNCFKNVLDNMQGRKRNSSLVHFQMVSFCEKCNHETCA